MEKQSKKSQSHKHKTTRDLQVEQQSTKPPSDRVKRDEWSEGAVSSLLEAYERKWVLRNRAKLKGQDWDDVARHVSSRGGSTKSPKTQTQCKNKVESMKKRYRSESASSSSWPLYSRLHLLLLGTGPTPPPPPPPPELINHNHSAQNNNDLLAAAAAVETPPVMLPPPPPPPPQNSNGSNEVDRVPAKQEDEVATNKNTLPDKDKTNNNNNSMDATSDSSSTPALYSETAAEKSPRRTPNSNAARTANNNNNKRTKTRRRDQSSEVAESVRWLAEAVVKSERARAQAMTEIEKMRAEAEAKRGEMDLRRTEIIANTQLEIARIFAGITTTNGNNNNNSINTNKSVDSSLRIGRN